MQVIEDRVIDLIKKLFDVDEAVLSQKKNVFLTGREFQLNHLDMLVLMLNLEKCFGIKFDKDDLLDYGLATIENITMVISKKLD